MPFPAGPWGDVPRETQAAVDEIFGDRIDLIAEYATALATSAVERGLIGPREVPRLWDRHIVNCAVVASLIPDGARVVDVGSGAGLPGLVLSIARPDLQVTLLEPLLRRVTWLDEVVDDLGLASVLVVRGRAEEHAVGRPDFDVATARAVAPLATLVGWCLPLVATGGVLLAMKGEAAATELREAGEVLRRLGADEGELVDLPAGSSATTVVRLRRVSSPPSVAKRVPPRATRRPGARREPAARKRGGR